MKKVFTHGKIVCLYSFLFYFVFVLCSIVHAQILENTTVAYGKEVYLTFDDGPSGENTERILNILKKNKVKATFFVVGNKAKCFPDELRKLSSSGMCILPHSYTHDYKKIYRSVDDYINDLNQCCSVIRCITGRNVLPYTRLPGGSDNLVTSDERMRNIRKILNQSDIYYVDWNVSSGDASGNNIPMNTIKNNVIRQCKDKKVAVVLMHDSYYKTTTVEALPYIISNLKEQGFVFKTFDEITPEQRNIMIRQGIINRNCR